MTPVVDSQVHIWAASTPERPWPARHKPHRDVPFGASDLLAEMATAGVDRAVLVPPSWEGERNDVVLQAAREHPDRFAVMGRLNLDAEDVLDQIRDWRNQPGMLGVRITFKHQGDPDQEWLWTALEKASVPVMMTVLPDQLQIIEAIAARHPEVRLTIDHLGISKGRKDEEAFAHLPRLCALARSPNIAVKASSLPTYTSDSYPYRRLHGHIRRVYDAFGPKRVFWGSDLTKLPCTYLQAVTMFTEEMPWLGPDDRHWIMGQGLCDWLGWRY